MGALPLMLVHIRLDFADLPELRAEAEVHVFSRVLRPMGYMPLTGEHNMDDRSPQPHGSGTGTRAAPTGQHPCPCWGDRSSWERMQRHGTRRGKGQDLGSPPHPVACSACTPTRELPFPASWAFTALGYTAN